MKVKVYFALQLIDLRPQLLDDLLIVLLLAAQLLVSEVEGFTYEGLGHAELLQLFDLLPQLFVLSQ